MNSLCVWLPAGARRFKRARGRFDGNRLLAAIAADAIRAMRAAGELQLEAGRPKKSSTQRRILVLGDLIEKRPYQRAQDWARLNALALQSANQRSLDGHQFLIERRNGSHRLQPTVPQLATTGAAHLRIAARGNEYCAALGAHLGHVLHGAIAHCLPNTQTIQPPKAEAQLRVDQIGYYARWRVTRLPWSAKKDPSMA